MIQNDFVTLNSHFFLCDNLWIKNSMVVLGITGTFGSGKSFVTKTFKKLGVPVIDADSIAHTLLKSGDIAAIIKKKFATTNRKELGKIVFSHQKERKELERILHPVIIKRIKEKLLANIKSPPPSLKLRRAGLVAIELPLLFEARAIQLVDKILVVSAKKNLILKRMLSVGRFKKEEILKRMRSQISLREKERRADFIINNNGTKEETRKQVKKIYQKLTQKV